ncbi:MAG TPA: type VI secretion system tube protein Hcp [Solirubrobacteraceae bacterium]|jgi:type VI protein secretion system component Hcp|nr:type VI secretion system tube protein Hcp [Solirubrobacteraceae bacterium]
MQRRILRFRSRRAAWAAIAVAAAAAALTVTQAFASDTSSTIYACVSKDTGTVQIVAQGTTCRSHDYATSWNVTGPQGDTGPTGPQGPAGAAASDPTPRQRVIGKVTLTPDGADINGMSSTPISFDIYDFSSAYDQSVTIGSGSTGAGAGKVTFQPITITKLPDASSPELFQMLTDGDHFARAEVQLYGKDGTTVAETFDYSLVGLASITTTNTGATSDQLFEQLTLEIGAVTDTVGSNSGGWNRVTNSAS